MSDDFDYDKFVDEIDNGELDFNSEEQIVQEESPDIERANIENKANDKDYALHVATEDEKNIVKIVDEVFENPSEHVNELMLVGNIIESGYYHRAVQSIKDDGRYVPTDWAVIKAKLAMENTIGQAFEIARTGDNPAQALWNEIHGVDIKLLRENFFKDENIAEEDKPYFEKFKTIEGLYSGKEHLERIRHYNAILEDPSAATSFVTDLGLGLLDPFNYITLGRALKFASVPVRYAIENAILGGVKEFNDSRFAGKEVDGFDIASNMIKYAALGAGFGAFAQKYKDIIQNFEKGINETLKNPICQTLENANDNIINDDFKNTITNLTDIHKLSEKISPEANEKIKSMLGYVKNELFTADPASYARKNFGDKGFMHGLGIRFSNQGWDTKPGTQNYDEIVFTQRKKSTEVAEKIYENEYLPSLINEGKEKGYKGDELNGFIKMKMKEDFRLLSIGDKRVNPHFQEIFNTINNVNEFLQKNHVIPEDLERRASEVDGKIILTPDLNKLSIEELIEKGKRNSSLKAQSVNLKQLENVTFDSVKEMKETAERLGIDLKNPVYNKFMNQRRKRYKFKEGEEKVQLKNIYREAAMAEGHTFKVSSVITPRNYDTDLLKKNPKIANELHEKLQKSIILNNPDMSLEEASNIANKQLSDATTGGEIKNILEGKDVSEDTLLTWGGKTVAISDELLSDVLEPEKIFKNAIVRTNRAIRTGSFNQVIFEESKGLWATYSDVKNFLINKGGEIEGKKIRGNLELEEIENELGLDLTKSKEMASCLNQLDFLINGEKEDIFKRNKFIKLITKIKPLVYAYQLSRVLLSSVTDIANIILRTGIAPYLKANFGKFFENIRNKQDALMKICYLNNTLENTRDLLAAAHEGEFFKFLRKLNMSEFFDNANRRSVLQISLDSLIECSQKVLKGNKLSRDENMFFKQAGLTKELMENIVREFEKNGTTQYGLKYIDLNKLATKNKEFIAGRLKTITDNTIPIAGIGNLPASSRSEIGEIFHQYLTYPHLMQKYYLEPMSKGNFITDSIIAYLPILYGLQYGIQGLKHWIANDGKELDHEEIAKETFLSSIFNIRLLMISSRFIQFVNDPRQNLERMSPRLSGIEDILSIPCSLVSENPNWNRIAKKVIRIFGPVIEAAGNRAIDATIPTPSKNKKHTTNRL